MILHVNGVPLTVVKKIHQKKENDEIFIYIYHWSCDEWIGGDLYFYSVQIHLGRLIQSFFPRVLSDGFFTIWEAKGAAIRRIKQLVKNSQVAKSRLERFDLVQIDQREFDF